MSENKQQGLVVAGEWITDRLPTERDANRLGCVIVPSRHIDGFGYVHFSVVKPGKAWSRPLQYPPYVPPKPETKTVPFDSVADFGDVFPVYCHCRHGLVSQITAWYEDQIFMANNGGWSTMKERADLGCRWSASPATPWDACKPFTKEVPA